MLSIKDKSTLINKPNKYLGDFHDRIMIKEAPNSICEFYEKNKDKIKGAVIIVRSKDDEPLAASARNTEDKLLFVFSDKYNLTNYFSSVCENVELSKALLSRALN